MKPARLVMTHHLVMSYKLNEKMEIYVRIIHGNTHREALWETEGGRRASLAQTATARFVCWRS